MSLVDSSNPSDGNRNVELSEFHYSILMLLSDETTYGLGVKRRLGEYYGEEINSGKLYPNLDRLAIAGLISKRELDQRTNEYSLKQAGLDAVIERIHWAIDMLIDDPETAETIKESIRREASLPD